MEYKLEYIKLYNIQYTYSIFIYYINIGHLSGRGVITLPSGDRIEGVLHGAWHEEVKINHGSFLRLQQQTEGISHPPGRNLFFLLFEK